MRSLFALAAFALVSLNAHAAIPATILEVVKQPGFEMNPEARTLAVLDNGDIIINVTELRGNNQYSIQVGHLEESAVRELQRQVSYVPADGKLVDPKKGQPMCTDTPTVETAVFLKGKRKVIGFSGGCHTHHIENSAWADALVSFGMIFLHTSK